MYENALNSLKCVICGRATEIRYQKNVWNKVRNLKIFEVSLTKYTFIDHSLFFPNTILSGYIEMNQEHIPFVLFQSFQVNSVKLVGIWPDFYLRVLFWRNYEKHFCSKEKSSSNFESLKLSLYSRSLLDVFRTCVYKMHIFSFNA